MALGEQTMKFELGNTSKPTEEPINIYEFSLFRSIRNRLIFFVLTSLFFIWWSDIPDLLDLWPIAAFFFIFIGAHLLYSYSKKEKTTIKVFESGLSIHDDFTSWSEIDSVDYSSTDIDSTIYTLIISKKDASEITCNLNLYSEGYDEIYRTVKTAFKMYANNN